MDGHTVGSPRAPAADGWTARRMLT